MTTAERITELERQNEGLRKALREVYSAFGIGEQARSPGILMSNLRNVIRFTEMLHAIEREFFRVPGEPDEDFPDEEPQDECLVNSWGSTVPEYVEQFRAALERYRTPAHAQHQHSSSCNCGADRTAAVGACVFPREVIRTLTEAHDCAMKNAIEARIPECGDFGGIAQNLAWVLDELERHTANSAAHQEGGA